jgi:citrate synthase
MSDSEGLSFPTSLGTSTADQIRLLGQDLTADLMGKVSFGELAFWLVTLRRPTPSETRVFEAVLVALADHGFTPTAIAARVTYLSAPDSLQGALAAGLLGGGSRFLGVTEDCGRYLHDVLSGLDGTLPSTDEGWDAVALSAVERTKAAGRFVPGLGHPVHKVTDPRTPVLIGIASEENLRGPHLRLFEAIGRVHEQVLGRRLPLNGAGVCGAALADLGLPVELLRGFALLARAAGLLGQIAESWSAATTSTSCGWTTCRSSWWARRRSSTRTGTTRNASSACRGCGSRATRTWPPTSCGRAWTPASTWPSATSCGSTTA